MSLRTRLRHKSNPLSKIYDFESIDDNTANVFCNLLKQRHIVIIDQDIQLPHVGNSTIKFIATPNDRILLEYIFRRIYNLDRIYLMDLSGYQGNRYKMMEDHYAIF